MVTKNPTSSQPRVMSFGPPVFIANPKSVRQPERIEMIVNETAKLENVFIPRRSSWAYPNWWRRSTSRDEAAFDLESTLITLLWRYDTYPRLLRVRFTLVSRTNIVGRGLAA